MKSIADWTGEEDVVKNIKILIRDKETNRIIE